MNGKRAKRIRKAARDLAKQMAKEDPGPGYEQIENCHSWVPAETYDPDGERMLKHVRSPGTIFHKSIFERACRILKKMYKEGSHNGRQHTEDA